MDCFFCQKGVNNIDYKDIELLKRFVTGMAKIRGKKRTGVCASHQRRLSQAIKRARFLALLPFTNK